jgi:hypothetical protein
MPPPPARNRRVSLVGSLIAGDWYPEQDTAIGGRSASRSSAVSAPPQTQPESRSHDILADDESERRPVTEHDPDAVRTQRAFRSRTRD